MKLRDLERSRSKRPVYSARVADEEGNSHYEFSIAGPQGQIEKIFARSHFEIEIASSVLEDRFAERSRRFWDRRIASDPRPAVPIETVTAALTRKMRKPPAIPKDPVIVCLRRTEGQGTFYGLWVPTLVLTPGTGLFFFLPGVWATWSAILRYTGNPDLFLNVGLPPPAAPVSRAISVGAISESVSWSTTPFPWNQMPAWHRVVCTGGATVVTHYAMVGHSIKFF